MTNAKTFSVAACMFLGYPAISQEMHSYSIDGNIRGLNNDSVIIYERKGTEVDTHYVRAVDGKKRLKKIK